MKKVGKGRGKEVLRHPWRPLYWMPILTVLLCLLVAQFILWGKLPDTSITIIPQIVAAIVAFVGAFRGTRIALRQRLLWGMANATAYGCILMLGNLLFFGEVFQSVVVTFLWILAAGLFGSLVANLKKGKNA